MLMREKIRDLFFVQERYYSPVLVNENIFCDKAPVNFINSSFIHLLFGLNQKVTKSSRAIETHSTIADALASPCVTAFCFTFYQVA